MGPFVESHDQELPYARYGLVTVVTIPTKAELPVVRGLQELGARVPPSRKRPLPQWPEEEVIQDDEVGDWEAQVDPWVEELTEAETTKVEVLAREWKEFLKDAKDVGDMKTLTFVHPVKSRAAKDILYGITRIYARIQALQIPVLRAHMDREKSFVSKEVTGWMAQKGLYCTYTAGDEPCGNARAEREIGVLRGRCRALMKSTRLDPGLWALAFRQAGEERLRDQLWQVGVTTPTLLPFGARAMVKKKTWFQRADPWKWPMTPVTLLGPAGDMSLTSGGYYCRDHEGRFFRSTVVVIPKQHATTAQALEAELSRLHEAAVPQGQIADLGGEGLQSGGDGEEPIFSDVMESSPARVGVSEATPWGAEDIFEAYQMRRQSTPEGNGISQSAHEGKRISQSAHEGKRVSQSVHAEAGSSQSLPESTGPNPDDVVLTEREDQDVLVVLDPPTRRIYGKATPGQLLPTAEIPSGPFLRHVRKGGEWTWASGGSEVAIAEAMAEEIEEQEELCDKLALWQHQRMKVMVQEEMAEILEGKITDGWIPELVEETKAMEQVMTVRASVKALAVPEVLQARTVPLEEVRRELDLWKPAFVKEYETLTSGPVEVLTEDQYKNLRDSGVQIEILPMKAVTVRKPDKYKARFVVCGNMATEPCVEDTSVGGICTVALRCMVHKAALSKWSLGNIDVAGAFLQAPRRGEKTTLVEPPAILRQMGLCAYGEKWRVRCALYGFTESPSDWGHFRDDTLRNLKWVEDGEEYKVEPTGEPHLWRVVKTCQDDQTVCGYVAIYVDDVLAAADEKVLKSFFKAVKTIWRCSEEEMVSQDAWMRFCGYELKSDGEGGFLLSQEHYVRDLLNRRQVTGKETVPLPKICEGEDEEMCGKALKEAQAVVGELQWISSRTRPDVAYGTGLLARMMHRRPKYTVQLAEHLLRYLRASTTRSLRYRTGDGAEDRHSMVVSTDASFAPEHEQFRSVTGIIIHHGCNALQWVSMRQPFVSQSTCEAELIAFAEGFQDGESTSAVLQLLEVPTSKKLVGDCKAALSQITQETGPWRTRHLRLRAAKLREAVKQGDWAIAHRPGAQLVADGGTKPLQGVAFRQFVQRLGMEDVAEPTGGQEPAQEKTAEEAKMRSLWPRADLCSEGGTALIGGGLALMCSDKHRRLATLLLTCGLLVKGWGGIQDRYKEDKDRNKDSEKEMGKEPTKKSGSGTAASLMGVTGKPQKVGKVDIGESKDEKNRKDPEGTICGDPNSSGGSATPKGHGQHREVPHSRPSQNGKEEQEGVVVPGLRAMRRDPGGASHGKGSSAAARGAAAMASGASTVGGKGYAAGSPPPRVSTVAESASSSQGPGGTTVNVTINVGGTAPSYFEAVSESGPMTFGVGENLTTGAEQAEGPTITSRGGMESFATGAEPARGPMITSRGRVDHFATGAEPAREPRITSRGGVGRQQDGRQFFEDVYLPTDGDYPQTVYMENDMKMREGFPEWRFASPLPVPEYEPFFRGRPLGQDRWDTRFASAGWLVRIHAKERKRLFHPVHRGCPYEVGAFHANRISVRFTSETFRYISDDNWHFGGGNRITQDNLPWKGFTIFKLMDTTPAADYETPCGDVAEEPSEDEGFEFVRP